MKESEKRARIQCAEIALRLALSYTRRGTAFTRNQMFMLNESEARDTELIKASLNKTWQKGFVERLVKNDVLIREDSDSSHVKYVTHTVKATAILEDHENDGLQLSWYLFPSEVIIPAAKEEPEDVPEDGDEEEPSGDELSTEVEGNPKDEDISAPAGIKLLLQLTGYIRDVARTQDGILEALRRLAQYMKDTEEDHKAPTAINDEGIRMLKNRIDGLGDKQDSATSLLNGLIRLVKESAAKSDDSASIKLLTEQIAQVVPNVQETLGLPPGETLAPRLGRLFNTITDLKQSVLGATTQMTKVAAVIDAREEDRIGKALKQIADMKQDLGAVEELLTEHMVKS